MAYDGTRSNGQGAENHTAQLVTSFITGGGSYPVPLVSMPKLSENVATWGGGGGRRGGTHVMQLTSSLSCAHS